MERMYNIREQVLDVAAANIKRAQKIQARSYNAKHCRNAFEVGEKVWRKNPLWNTKQKSLKKGPKWYGPYEVAERKGGGNGNYLLIALSGKNKGQVCKKSYPPNHLKRFIHRNPEIPDASDSKYGSDNEDSVPASQESGIGLQESVPENPSPIPSDSTTVLYPNPDEGDTLLSHTLDNDPSCTLPKMTVHIAVCTPSSCDDDAFLPDLAETEPATPVPVHTERTLSAAEILADLSEGSGGVSGHNESAESIQLQLEVSTNSEQQTQEVDVKNTQYEDQTMETIDPDLIVNGVEDLKPMVFHPFSLYMRKQVATTVNINVGRKHGLGLRADALRYHGTCEQCTGNFHVHTVDGDGNCFFRSISYLLLGSEAKHDVVRNAVCNYIIQPENWYKLKANVDGDITSGEEYVRKSEMHVWGKWATHVELFALAQLTSKDVCVYTLEHWMRYPASGTSKRPTKNAFYLANHHNVHFDPVLGVYPGSIFYWGRHVLTKAKDAASASFDWRHVHTFTTAHLPTKDSSTVVRHLFVHLISNKRIKFPIYHLFISKS